MFNNPILRIKRIYRSSCNRSWVYLQWDPNARGWIRYFDLKCFFKTFLKGLADPDHGLRSPYWNKKHKVIDLGLKK